MSLYLAKHQRQTTRFQGKLIGCTETSFAMFVDASTVGGCLVTEQIVRALSSEPNPDPASPGLNIGQLDAVAAKLHVYFADEIGATPDGLRTFLRQNRRLVVQLWAADIGGPAVGHAAEVETRAKQNGVWKWLVNDPLRVAAEWIPESDMLHAMQTFADKNGLKTGLYAGTGKVVPRLLR